MRVAIVGGGVIGLCCAWSLKRRGAEVTVIERGRCGEGASHGNAGWITPVLSAPVPGPGVMRQAARWMRDPESPLYVRPRPDPAFLAWSWRFARACRPGPHAAGTAATAALADGTARLFEELRREIAFELHADGLLFAALAPGKLGGFPGRRLSREQLRDFEPALSGAVAEGLFSPGELHVRPETLVAGLAAALRDDIEEGREVSDLRDLDGYDRVVVAAGVHTRRFVALPLLGAKGYSITVEPAEDPPRRPLYLYEIKVGVSPFEGALRLAGTLELGTDDLSVDERRVGAIARGAQKYLPGRFEGVQWAGMRPLVPDGLPVIGRVDERVYVATGHSMLGITLAPATGEALAPYVLTGERPAVLGPLGPERFTSGRAAAATRRFRSSAAC
jgi:D-amino-acid dehydrogenase